MICCSRVMVTPMSAPPTSDCSVRASARQLHPPVGHHVDPVEPRADHRLRGDHLVEAAIERRERIAGGGGRIGNPPVAAQPPAMLSTANRSVGCRSVR